MDKEAKGICNLQNYRRLEVLSILVVHPNDKAEKQELPPKGYTQTAMNALQDAGYSLFTVSHLEIYSKLIKVPPKLICPFS